MNTSILPVYVLLVFAVCIALTRRASANRSIDLRETWAVYGLLAALFVWTITSAAMGLRGKHVELMGRVPLLWQALVPVIVWSTALIAFGPVRNGLRGIATSTPGRWLVLIQVLRVGAIGGIVKGVRGEITSDYVFWIGIPDFLFGLSAVGMFWLVLREAVSPRALIVWNLIGFSLILLPTFVPMLYWMKEPGFIFIFEFPMVLAPSIVVSTLISLNLLHVWGIWRSPVEART